MIDGSLQVWQSRQNIVQKFLYDYGCTWYKCLLALKILLFVFSLFQLAYMNVHYILVWGFRQRYEVTHTVPQNDNLEVAPRDGSSRGIFSVNPMISVRCKKMMEWYSFKQFYWSKIDLVIKWTSFFIKCHEIKTWKITNIWIKKTNRMEYIFNSLKYHT